MAKCPKNTVGSTTAWHGNIWLRHLRSQNLTPTPSIETTPQLERCAWRLCAADCTNTPRPHSRDLCIQSVVESRKHLVSYDWEVTAQNDLCVSQKGYLLVLDFYLAPKYKDSKGSQKFYFHVYKKSDSHMKLGFPWADTQRRHNLIQFRHHYWWPSTPRISWAIKIDIIKKKKNQMPICVPESSKKKKKKSNRHHGSL